MEVGSKGSASPAVSRETEVEMNLNEAIKDVAVTNARAFASTDDRSGEYLTDCVRRRTEYRYTDAEIVRELVKSQ